MPVDEQVNTVFQMGKGDLPGKPNAGAHVERRVSGDNLFECEKASLRRAGRQPERLGRGHNGWGRNIVLLSNRDGWCDRCRGRS